ncbi:MAG: polymerase, sigma-24 subunit, subfamily, partial [Solirubrobacterales bacterium]|nr:polymerase, sigma-24 subunit, subfamily [Solirubrobacterales bacterium]
MEASALQAPASLARPRLSVSVPLLRLRSDEQLVALFRAGNDDAFRVIHDRYRARLFAYARQMLPGSRQDAEDALQDVFVRAHRALRASDRPVSLRAWLYRVSHNRCIDELRRPVPPAPEVLELVRPPAADPLAEVERREDLRRLVADVRRLPEQQRSALLMRELNGLSYNEMADALEVTVPAVKSLLVRARIGLAQAGEARDTDCEHIRLDLMDAHDRGVRATGMARRHLRDCPGCRDYRSGLRGMSRSMAALVPGLGPIALAAKLLGLG